MLTSLPTVFILAGGLGTRLAHIVTDVPKPMAPVAGRPFLEWQIESFRRQGVQNFVLLVGHKREVIQDHFGDGSAWGVRIKYSVEEELLGTGGAFLKALTQFPCEEFILVNGDSYFDVSLSILLGQARRGGARLAIALKPKETTSRYGAVDLRSDGSIARFLEKDPAGPPGLINGGVYAGASSLFAAEGVRRVSMETELFPRLVNQGSIIGVPCGEPFIDIGVPEDYARVQQLLPVWHSRTRHGALFLDRDGILIEDTGYVSDPARLRFLDTALPVMEEARRLGLRTIVITNQAGAAKGRFALSDIEAVNRAVGDHFQALGFPIDAFYSCPHHPEGKVPELAFDCFDRKPKPGLVLKAVEEFAVDLEASLMVGDKDSDVIICPGLQSYLIEGAYTLQKTERIRQPDDLPQLLRSLNMKAD